MQRQAKPTKNKTATSTISTSKIEETRTSANTTTTSSEKKGTRSKFKTITKNRSCIFQCFKLMTANKHQFSTGKYKKGLKGRIFACFINFQKTYGSVS